MHRSLYRRLSPWKAAPVLLAIALTGLTSADEPAPGLPPGTPAPAFELSGADGQRHRLDALVARDKILALLFYRSADW